MTSVRISNDAPDDEAESKEKRMAKHFEPRSYQTKVFEVALRRNTIAVLETGAGKTMIAVMLIREFAETMRITGDKRLIIFLAPSVYLVNQQFAEIKLYTDLEAGEYYGAKGIDNWNKEDWAKEISEKNVMVMTPQILLDAYRKAFFTISMVRLLIFDECHHASGNHPYTRILKEFYHKAKERPNIFGMTASPVIRKGVSSTIDCEDQISELENLLDSKVYTVEDRTELEVVLPSAKEINRYYDPMLLPNKDLKSKLDYLWAKFDASMCHLQQSCNNQFKDVDDALKTLRRRFSNSYANIIYCIDELGLICALQAAKIYMENTYVSSASLGYVSHAESAASCRCFLRELLCLFEETVSVDVAKLMSTEHGCQEAVRLGYISPKLFELIQIFKSLEYGVFFSLIFSLLCLLIVKFYTLISGSLYRTSKEILCLIFVERIITAVVIKQVAKLFSSLSYFTVSYLTGGNSSVDTLTPKIHKATLDSFRSGKVNLLLTTDVAEEGIHVPNCSCVIRFDLPRTVRSFVQSRGRARQDGSQYILMVERGNLKQREMLFHIIRSEHSMTDTALNRDPNRCISEPFCNEEMEIYLVESTGAIITKDSSIDLIHKYCGKLPGDRYFTPKPHFELSIHGKSHNCTLTLPPNAAFPSIVGPFCQNSHLAKQLVCLKACKRLHQMGALNDHLLPCNEECYENQSAGASKESHPGEGTTKRKELHGTSKIHALSGSWALKPGAVTLQAYEIHFCCDQANESYSGFVLLVESTLPEDVANTVIELYLQDKLVKASISSGGKVHLNEDQVNKSKLFQAFFFNGLFGKLFIDSKTSEAKREFLLKSENISLWNASNMYLLLPLEPKSNPRYPTLSINWKEIYSCASVTDFLSDKTRNLFIGENTDQNEIFLTNGFVHIDNLKDMVVLATHTGRLYSVLEVKKGMSAESSFDGTTNTESPLYSSFSDYFKKKYQIVLEYPGQPLLLLKQSHNAHNLLSLKAKCIGSRNPMDKVRNHVYMPPELVLNVGVSIDVLKSFYLLPSVMYRLESLLLAAQLREEIGSQSNTCYVPSSLILEATTTMRCCEDFSLERLELLGDSVLKYAVSCHLFLSYPKKHEGQLSARRSWAVCNATLHRLGVKKRIQGFIRDCPFDPRRWIAPGQLTSHPVPCNCGVNSSEVPVSNTYQSDEDSITIGKRCDKGHRWICSKTISDCVEALIGAYYVAGGLNSSLSLMKWLGVDVNPEYDLNLVTEVLANASVRCYIPKAADIYSLERKLGYEFCVKGLLLEAITHGSQHQLSSGYCYQRLEFLGDAVLDIVITWHLFQTHKDIDPGELTDLRSALVNNENFARAAVKHNLQAHLQHESVLLLSQIAEYASSVAEFGDRSSLQSVGTLRGPKVLGDIVESIAGAILIDAKLDLMKVWDIFHPILSPIVTPDKLELPPLRELNELCSHLGYFITTKCTNKGDMVVVELGVQLKDALLVRQGCEKTRKAAKGQAAFLLLKDLQKRGISHSHLVAKRKHYELEIDDENSHISMDAVNESSMDDEHKHHSSPKKRKNGHNITDKEHSPDGLFMDKDLVEPVTVAINMDKGGPRIALYTLCQKMQWPLPKFEFTQQNLSVPMTIGDESEGKKGFVSFTAQIALNIPNSTAIKLLGEPRTDKKRAQDSSAMVLLKELENRGKCILEIP